MVEVTIYDAGAGDCLRIRYCGTSGKYRNILVDSGTIRFGAAFTRLCAEIQKNGEQVDLLIITHTDDDHLGGLLHMVRQGISVHADTVVMNHPDGFAAAPEHCDVPLSLRHNDMIFRSLSASDSVPRRAVKGEQIPLDGAKLHILHPTQEKMSRLFGPVTVDTPLAMDDRGVPLEVLAEKELPSKDASCSNGASIIFIFEYAEKRLLFTGDAWAEDILDSVRSWAERERIETPVHFDAVKLPHHGSARNISEEWPKVIQTQQHLICADGRTHPDKLTVAKLLKWYDSTDITSAGAWWDNGYFSETDREQFIEPGKLILHQGKGGVSTCRI